MGALLDGCLTDLVLALLLLFLHDCVGALYLGSKILLCVDAVPVFEIFSVGRGSFNRAYFVHFGVLFCGVVTCLFDLSL